MPDVTGLWVVGVTAHSRATEQPIPVWRSSSPLRLDAEPIDGYGHPFDRRRDTPNARTGRRRRMPRIRTLEVAQIGTYGVSS